MLNLFQHLNNENPFSLLKGFFVYTLKVKYQLFSWPLYKTFTSYKYILHQQTKNFHCSFVTCMHSKT